MAVSKDSAAPLLPAQQGPRPLRYLPPAPTQQPVLQWTVGISKATCIRVRAGELQGPRKKGTMNSRCKWPWWPVTKRPPSMFCVPSPPCLDDVSVPGPPTLALGPLFPSPRQGAPCLARRGWRATQTGQAKASTQPGLPLRRGPVGRVWGGDLVLGAQLLQLEDRRLVSAAVARSCPQGHTSWITGHRRCCHADARASSPSANTKCGTLATLRNLGSQDPLGGTWGSWGLWLEDLQKENM